MHADAWRALGAQGYVTSLVGAEAIAEEYGFELVPDVDTLIGLVDIVDIVTPSSTHADFAQRAIARGLDVICEKPLVGSLKEIDEVIAVETQSTGKLMPVFQYRFGNGVQQAKAIIDAGLAGKPFVGTVETLWRREAPSMAAASRSDRGIACKPATKNRKL